MSKGAALPLVIVILSVLLLLGASLSKLVYNAALTGHLEVARWQAFYLAQAGIEMSKHRSGWYTDLPYGGEKKADWLIDGAVGQVVEYGGGRVKMVKELGKEARYAVGYAGRARAVLGWENEKLKVL